MKAEGGGNASCSLLSGLEQTTTSAFEIKYLTCDGGKKLTLFCCQNEVCLRKPFVLENPAGVINNFSDNQEYFLLHPVCGSCCAAPGIWLLSALGKGVCFCEEKNVKNEKI